MKELDNRGSSFYIARYWSEEMAKHDSAFSTLAAELKANEDQIVKEMLECQVRYSYRVALLIRNSPPPRIT